MRDTGLIRTEKGAQTTAETVIGPTGTEPVPGAAVVKAAAAGTVTATSTMEVPETQVTVLGPETTDTPETGVAVERVVEAEIELSALNAVALAIQQEDAPRSDATSARELATWQEIVAVQVAESTGLGIKGQEGAHLLIERPMSSGLTT